MHSFYASRFSIILRISPCLSQGTGFLQLIFCLHSDLSTQLFPFYLPWCTITEIRQVYSFFGEFSVGVLLSLLFFLKGGSHVSCSIVPSVVIFLFNFFPLSFALVFDKCTVIESVGIFHLNTFPMFPLGSPNPILFIPTLTSFESFA